MIIQIFTVVEAVGNILFAICDYFWRLDGSLHFQFDYAACDFRVSSGERSLSAPRTARKNQFSGLLLAWCGFMFGCFTALITRQPPEDVTAIAIETGVQNTGIALAVLKVCWRRVAANK